MVVLTLTPYRGNHQRFFPHAGFLGLTPIIVQGSVRTALQEDNKPLKASSIVVRVRCYEVDNSHRPMGKTRRKATHVLYEQLQVVWQKRGDEEWTELGELQRPFRIVVPVDAPGAVSTSTYKTYRSWWQVEAVIMHKPSSMHGSRKLVSHQIPLFRYALPPATLPAPTLPSWTGTSRPNSGGSLSYTITATSPTATPGPGEELAFNILLRREGPGASAESSSAGVQIRRISLSLDRHMTLDTNQSPSPDTSDDDEASPPAFPLGSGSGGRSPPRQRSVDAEKPSQQQQKQQSPPPHAGRSASRGLSSVFKRGPSAGGSRSPLPSPSYAPALSQDPGCYFSATPLSLSPAPGSTPTRSVTSTSMLVLEAVEDVVFGSEMKLVGAMPKTKSIFRYSVGETMKTRVAQVAFTLSGRIVLRHRSGAQEIVELEPKPIVVAGTSLEEREKALAHAGRILAVSEADLKQFDPATAMAAVRSASLSPSPSSPPSYTSKMPTLGNRRTSNFMLTVDTSQPEPSPPTVETSDSRLAPRAVSVRRRSEQSDMPIGAPVKTRARFGGPSSSPEEVDDNAGSGGPTPPASAGYNALALAQPLLAQNCPPGTPPTPSSLAHTPTTFADAVALLQRADQRSGFFPLATAPPRPYSTDSPSTLTSLSHTAAAQQRSNRRTGRSPYSSLHRPRSAGQLSLASQRSNMSSQDGAASNASIRSIASFGTASSSSTIEYIRDASCTTLAMPDELPSLSLIDNSPVPPLSPHHVHHSHPPNGRFASASPEAMVISAPPSPAMSDASTFSGSSTNHETATTAATEDIDLDDLESLDDMEPCTPPIIVARGSTVSTLHEIHDAESDCSHPSVNVDFRAFSLSAPPLATRALVNRPEPIDSATLAQIAPWSVVEDVSPFDRRRPAPAIRSTSAVSSAAGQQSSTTVTWSAGYAPSAQAGASSMSRALSSGRLSPGGVADGGMYGAGRRKSAGGLGLFGGSSKIDAAGEDGATKDGGRWGFLRRASRA